MIFHFLYVHIESSRVQYKHYLGNVEEDFNRWTIKNYGMYLNSDLSQNQTLTIGYHCFQSDFHQFHN